MVDKRQISFSPPDISEDEINEVADAMRSGWITTGPKTKELEKRLADFIGTGKFVALNSGTAAMELTYRLFGIGPGDEVITTAYTYTATAAAAVHVGAKIVLVDILGDKVYDKYKGHSPYEPDYDMIEDAINDRTKVIVPVDIGGVMCDYDRVIGIAESHRAEFKPTDNRYQQALGRILVMADDAHALGAHTGSYKVGGVAPESVCSGPDACGAGMLPEGEYMAGAAADFSCFSFHAVKNFTTAEGGGISWRTLEGIDDDDIYKEFMILSLHGQSKDALAKTKLGAWEYDILYPGYKCNMTDVAAAMGLGQLRRYQGILERRREIIDLYDRGLSEINRNRFGGSGSVIPWEAAAEYGRELPKGYITTLTHFTDEYTSSGHLYLMRVAWVTGDERSDMITRLAEEGIATNVHYKPLPMLTAYKDMGFSVEEYPQAYRYFVNEITLPLHTLLADEDIEYIIKMFDEISEI